MRKTRRKRIKLPVIKKSVRDFLLSEEGKISSKGVLKIGLSVAMAGLLPVLRAEAQHSSYFFQGGVTCADAAGGHISSGG